MHRIYSLIFFLCSIASVSATINVTAIANNLRGPVKSVKSVTPGITKEYLEFDRQGRVIFEINDADYQVVYVWNDDGTVYGNLVDGTGEPIGNINTYYWTYNNNTFIFKASDQDYNAYVDDGNGNLKGKYFVEEGKTQYHNFHFDNKHRLTSYEHISSHGVKTLEVTIVEAKYDHYGNCTEMKWVSNSNGEENTTIYQLTYYDE